MASTAIEATDVVLGPVEKEAMAIARRVARSRTDLRIITEDSVAASIVASFDNFLLDCDGVLWMAGETLAAVRETITMLQGLGKKVLFVTNNSCKSRAMYAKKMAGLGFNVSEADLIPSSYAAASYLKSERPDVKKAFVVGSQGLVDEIEGAGVECVGGPRRGDEASMSEAEFARQVVDSDIGAVVCGWDQHFTFRKLCLASLVLQKAPDAAFVATNRDVTDRLDDRYIPGNGCALAALEVASRRDAFCTGKPSRWLSRRVIEEHCLDPERTIMVGDRLDTDMMFGNAGGMATMLVLTGCSTEEDLVSVRDDDPARPDFVLPFFGMLYTATRSGRSVPVDASHTASHACAAESDADASEGGAGGRSRVDGGKPRSRL